MILVGTFGDVVVLPMSAVGEATVAFSARDAGVENLAPTATDSALRVLCGVANG